MRIFSILKRKEGAALVMMLAAFLIVITLASSVIILSQNNTKQVSAQDQGINSYYIARSGAEATYQALITTASLLQVYETGTDTTSDVIEFDEGQATVTVTGYNEGDKRRVRITSVGIADGTSISRTSILEFDYVGYGNIKWSR